MKRIVVTIMCLVAASLAVSCSRHSDGSDSRLAVCEAVVRHMIVEQDKALCEAAPSFDLGACWLGYFQIAAASWPTLQAALGLPEGNICLGALAVGYPQFKYHRLPLRNEPQIVWH